MSAPQEPAASVLAVMAHPDDAELWIGGTLALHAQAGAKVTVVVAHEDAARMAEAAEGACRLGASLRALPPQFAVEDVRALMTTLRPDVLITHRSDDVHPEHRRVADIVLHALPEAVIETGRPRRLYTCDTYNSLTLTGPVPAGTIVDVSATFAVKMHALAAHAGTQPIENHFGPMAENLGRLWGARIGAVYGEAFTALPILGRLPAAAGL